MPYIDTKYIGDCNYCRHHRTGGCDTWCECGECFEPNMTKIPLADVVEVVRCKYCDYGKPFDIAYEGAIECMHEGCGFVCNGDHFCSYGKRKDGADDA